MADEMGPQNQPRHPALNEAAKNSLLAAVVEFLTEPSIAPEDTLRWEPLAAASTPSAFELHPEPYAADWVRVTVSGPVSEGEWVVVSVVRGGDAERYVVPVALHPASGMGFGSFTTRSGGRACVTRQTMRLEDADVDDETVVRSIRQAARYTRRVWRDRAPSLPPALRALVQRELV